jgi:small subunit ribosomal protein S8
MFITDPIADMLTRIRNANQAKHETVKIPASNLKVEIARVLKEEGYISEYLVKEIDGKKEIEVTLKYGANKTRIIKGIKRISTPGLRVYSKASELPKVLNGLGVAIISTSNGVMTDRDARRQKLGGEVIAYVW